jgi:hypothetical protein
MCVLIFCTTFVWDISHSEKNWAPYRHRRLWPVPLYNVFPHYLINGTIFEKKLLKTKCVFWFSVQLLSETFFTLRRTERHIVIVICDLSRSRIFFPHYLINGTIFEKKLLNTKCVFWFSVQRLFETFFIPRRIERDMINSVYPSSCKVPVIVFVRF